MACNAWRDRLDAVIDGELPAEAMREFAAHLHECPSCTADIAGRQQLKTAVKRAALGRFAPRTAFRRRIETQILAEKSSRPAPWIWPAFAAAAAVLIALLWLAGPSRNFTVSTMGEVVDLHVTALASANPVDVVSTDLHTVKPWFEGKLPFAVNPPDLAGTPFTLLGGRVSYLDQEPGAGLLFQFRKHRLSAFIFQDQPAWKGLGAQDEPKRYASFWIETWGHGGLRYFVIGDTSGENVKQLSNLMRSATTAK